MAKLELEGMEDLVTVVEKLGLQGNRIENKALRAAGELVQAAIAGETPQRSGTLKDSIKTSGVRTRGGMKQVAVGPDEKGWYGKFVEFGTVKRKANPFMARGYEISKEKAVEQIAEELRKGLGL